MPARKERLSQRSPRLHPSSEQPAGWALRCSVSELKLCTCRPLQALGGILRAFGPRNRAKCWSQAATGGAALSVSDWSQFGLTPPLGGGRPLGLGCASRGSDGRAGLGELLSYSVAVEAPRVPARLSLPPRERV